MRPFKKIVASSPGAANVKVKLEGEERPVSIVDAFNQMADQLNELTGQAPAQIEKAGEEE
jgi:hypothetical protein